MEVGGCRGIPWVLVLPEAWSGTGGGRGRDKAEVGGAVRGRQTLEIKCSVDCRNWGGCFICR